MVNYEEIEGNLLALHDRGDFDFIGHGCNCFKIMGAGIARQIAIKYRDAYSLDQIDDRLPTARLGDFTVGLENRVINIYSQYKPGKNLDIEALTLSLRKINIEFKDYHIGLPQIGCGIAGGSWGQVREIIKKELSNMKVTVVIYKPNKNENTTT